MNRRPGTYAPFVLLACVGFAVVAAVSYSVSAAHELPTGPVDVAWDKSPCAACGMHVGEPPFAAQLTTTDGNTLVFDDPGCLFAHLHEHDLDVHSMFFRHVEQNRWITRDAVAFVPREQTPMGFGFAAIDASASAVNAMTFEQASRHCIDRVATQRDK